MCGWYGSAAPWYGMIFGPMVMIAFIVLTALIIAWALRALGLDGNPSQAKKTLRSTRSITASHAVKLIVHNTRIAREY